MNNADYLVTLADRPPEERKEIATMGGIASGKARKRNATIRDSLKMMLAMGVKNATTDDVLEFMTASGVENPTMAEAIATAAMLKSAKGDVEAMRFVRDSSGELPTNKVELSGDASRPIAQLDLTAMTDEQLRALAEGVQGAE